MHKCLYILCPTDGLEAIVNKAFKHKNYFYTTLGNSFMHDNETLKHLNDLAHKHQIKEIQFMLSKDNQIIIDALGQQKYAKISGLKDFYVEIEKQSKRSKMLQQSENDQLLILSCYLNKKIKELQFQFTNQSKEFLKISGKIYHRNHDVFTDIY
jgi:flagellar motility protein MotE (MotC chaperone)